MVKFGFLSFFRLLVDHMPRLQQYWKFTVFFTIICYLFALVDPFIACPKVGGLSSCKYAVHVRTTDLIVTVTCSRTRALAMGTTAIAVDIVSDILRKSIDLFSNPS